MSSTARRSLGCAAVLVACAAAIWLLRDPIGDWMGRLDPGGRSEPSEQLARSAEAKLEAIAREGLTRELRLSEAELQSLLTYRSAPVLPPGVEDPQIDVQDTIVVLSARLRPAELDASLGLEGLAAALGDTSRVLAGLAPAVERPGEILVRVRTLQLGSMVIPPLMLPAILGGLRSQGVPTSGGAVLIPVPPDVGGVSLDGDDVVLHPAG